MMTKLGVALAILALQFYGLHFFRTDSVIPERSEFAALPLEIEGWRCIEPETLSADVLDKLDVTDYFSCVFVAGDAPATSSGEPDGEQPQVHLYVGYHTLQSRSGAGGTHAIHPPEHCLPGSGWDIVDSRIVPVTVNGRTGEAKRFVIAKGNDRNLVFFWYQARNRIYAKSHEKILYTFLDRALHGRTDGALVRMTVRVREADTEEATRLVTEFVEDVTPVVDRFLPE